jgi:predicted RNase H-like nuclease (RuvC/YqgF family)
MSLMIGLFVIVLILLIAVIINLPAEKQKAKKKKREEAPIIVSPEQKHLEEKVVRLEHNIHSLKRDIEGWEKKCRDLEKNLAVESVKEKKLLEKLAQERSWKEKEDVHLAKLNRDIHDLKSELTKIQDQFSKEHMATLKLENEHKALQVQQEELAKQKRALDVENDQLKAKIESQRRDIAQLKSENVTLHKKEDDKSWVAKTEYQRLEMKLKEKEKEFERLKREIDHKE